jgi:hypothetical protein
MAGQIGYLDQWRKPYEKEENHAKQNFDIASDWVGCVLGWRAVYAGDGMVVFMVDGACGQ